MRTKKKITVATTISAIGKIKTGGANVVNGLYTKLSEKYDIDMLYTAPVYEKKSSIKITDGLTEHVIPRSKETDMCIKQLEQKCKVPSLYDVGLSYYLDKTPLFINSLVNSIKNSELIIIDRPFFFPLVQMYANGRAILHRSHNIEYLYRKSTIPQNEYSINMLDYLFQLERNCCNACDMNFSCSETDLNTMKNLYGTPVSKLRLLPNGVFCSDNKFISLRDRKKMKSTFFKSNYKIATFIGAPHQPNVEACELIYRIAPYCLDTLFVISGDVCQKIINNQKPENVVLLGRISEKTRKLLFAVTDMALNPMYSGSGTNVKMLDYMSMGIPIISSLFGARGIMDISGIKIANTEEEFIRAITDFNLDQYKETIINNRKMVEQEYDWEAIVSKTLKTIESFM